MAACRRWNSLSACVAAPRARTSDPGTCGAPTPMRPQLLMLNHPCRMTHRAEAVSRLLERAAYVAPLFWRRCVYAIPGREDSLRYVLLTRRIVGLGGLIRYLHARGRNDCREEEHQTGAFFCLLQARRRRSLFPNSVRRATARASRIQTETAGPCREDIRIPRTVPNPDPSQFPRPRSRFDACHRTSLVSPRCMHLQSVHPRAVRDGRLSRP